MVNYTNIITIEPGKRGGKPCIRGMRITVSDILGWLASGMTVEEIINDFDELTREDIYAALSYAADREKKDIPDRSIKLFFDFTGYKNSLASSTFFQLNF
jgi:uncharacterized protein (DUF433 family)